MKYKIGDEVEYYSREKIGIGTITKTYKVYYVGNPYEIDGIPFYYESKQEDIAAGNPKHNHQYIIKKIVNNKSNIPDFIKNLFTSS